MCYIYNFISFDEKEKIGDNGKDGVSISIIGFL